MKPIRGGIMYSMHNKMAFSVSALSLFSLISSPAADTERSSHKSENEAINCDPLMRMTGTEMQSTCMRMRARSADSANYKLHGAISAHPGGTNLHRLHLGAFAAQPALIITTIKPYGKTGFVGYVDLINI